MNFFMYYKKLLAIGMVILIGVVLAFVILRFEKSTSRYPHNTTAIHGERNDKVVGPHRGRLLSEADFQVEITIYEQGVPPRFRVYPFFKKEAINPDAVELMIELHRLGGRVDVINFQSEGAYLRGDKVVEEPHSFDVKVLAEWKGNAYRWEYSQVEGRIELAPEEIRNAGIVIETAAPVTMKTVIGLPGEIKLNADKVIHVVPRVSGVVTEVYKNLGDRVKYGEVIAAIDSREIAELKSAYRASLKRVELAQKTFQRKERLWKEKISSEKDYLESRQMLAEAEINLQEAVQTLLVLGFSQANLDSITEKTGGNLSRYEIRALYDGVVLDKHLSIGESVKEDADIFILADLSTVWVDVTVYAKDLNRVKVGQNVTVKSDVFGLEMDGILTYLGPLVGEQTRTVKGRIVVQNPEGHWRPGLFVTVEIVKEEVTVPVAVLADAIQTFRDWSVVFAQYGNFFEVRPLELGRQDGRWVEVIHGLSPGEKYAAQNSFILKADLGKAGATHDH